LKTKTISLAKFISAFALTILFSIGAMAQDKKADRAKVAADNMKTSLSLTDAQYKKVYDLNSDFFAKINDVRATETDKTVKGQKIKELNESKVTKLKEILTPEQYTTYIDSKKLGKEKFIGATQKNRYKTDTLKSVKIKQ